MSSPQLKSEKNYKIEKCLDSAALGAVHKISIMEDKRIYALKQFNLRRLSEIYRTIVLNDARKEYYLHRSSLPNVLRSFGSHYDEEEKVFKFTTELLEHNLAAYVNSKGYLIFNEFIPVFRDVVTGT